MNAQEFAVKIQQLAKIGLLFSKDPYALENYELLETLSREFLNEEMVATPIVKNMFERDIYPTPNISVRVIVLNEKQEVLMVQEKQDGGWAVPGGWCEIFTDLRTNAAKEVKEEAGVDIELGRLLAIFRRERYKNYPTLVSEYVHYFVANYQAGMLRPNHETTDVRFFSIHDLPILSKKNTLTELKQAWSVYEQQLEVWVD